MHSGFKGTRLGITELILRENKIIYELSFIDSEGVVHARMRHTRAIGVESDINTKVDDLITALLNEAAAMHYTSPAAGSAPLDLAPPGAQVGIAEAMGVAATAADEPDGTQG